jgi:hypothetical protein
MNKELVKIWKPDGSGYMVVHAYEVMKYVSMGWLEEPPGGAPTLKPNRPEANPAKAAKPEKTATPLEYAQAVSRKAHHDIANVKRDALLQALFAVQVDPPDSGTKAQLLELLDEKIEELAL